MKCLTKFSLVSGTWDSVNGLFKVGDPFTAEITYNSPDIIVRDGSVPAYYCSTQYWVKKFRLVLKSGIITYVFDSGIAKSNSYFCWHYYKDEPFYGQVHGQSFSLYACDRTASKLNYFYAYGCDGTRVDGTHYGGSYAYSYSKYDSNETYQYYGYTAANVAFTLDLALSQSA
jgi:hypothetical protein